MIKVLLPRSTSSETSSSVQRSVRLCFGVSFASSLSTKRRMSAGQVYYANHGTSRDFPVSGRQINQRRRLRERHEIG